MCPISAEGSVWLLPNVFGVWSINSEKENPLGQTVSVENTRFFPSLFSLIPPGWGSKTVNPVSSPILQELLFTTINDTGKKHKAYNPKSTGIHISMSVQIVATRSPKSLIPATT